MQLEFKELYELLQTVLKMYAMVSPKLHNVGVTGHFRVYMERIFATNIFVSIRIVGLSDQWRDTGILSLFAHAHSLPFPRNNSHFHLHNCSVEEVNRLFKLGRFVLRHLILITCGEGTIDRRLTPTVTDRWETESCSLAPRPSVISVWFFLLPMLLQALCLSVCLHLSHSGLWLNG